MKYLLIIVVVLGISFTGFTQPDTTNIDEVVITATKTSRILKSTPVEISLISNKEIEQSGAVTASDAIRWVPGVNISGGAPFGSARRFTGIIRGVPAQYSLILVDGKRIKGEHIHTGINLGILPVEMIQQIEVVKGPSCALYGSDAKGGVINIISKPIPVVPTLFSKVNFGSFNTKEGVLWYGQQKGKFGVLASGKYTDTDGFEDQWYKQFNSLIKLTYDITENNQISLNSKLYHINYLRGSTEVYDDELDVLLSWEKEFDSNNLIKVSGSYAEFNGNRKDATNTTSSAEMFYQDMITKHHNVIIGGEIRKEYFTRVAVQPGIEETISGAFLQDEISINNKIDGIVSLRLDKHPNIDPVWSPNISALYKPTPQTSIRANVGQGFRAPSIQDKYEYHFKHGNYYRDGNINLNPERSISYSFGLEQKLFNYTYGRITVFRNEFSDMIIVLNTGDVETDGIEIHQRQNINKAFTQGIETELKYKTAPVNIIIGYTYLDTEDDEGNVLSYNPQHLITTRTYVNIYKYDITAMLSTESSFNRYYQNKKQEVEKLSDYTLLNFNISKRFFDSFQIYATVGNILNKEFDTYEEGKTFLGAGRTYTVGIKHQFKKTKQ